MSVAKGTWKNMGDELIHKRGEGLKECIRGGPRGITHVYLFNPHFLNFIMTMY
jgi:hypothetical protein